MKRGFTLIELMVVTVILITLMTLVFKLSGIGDTANAKNVTVSKMQRLENCLSGYYAAFGSYPPVPIHGSRSIYYKVNRWGIQQDGGESGSPDEDPNAIVWERVDAACKSQPVSMDFPIKDEGVKRFVEGISELHKRQHDKDPNSSFGQNPLLGTLYSVLNNPQDLSSKRDMSKWSDVQIFRFGLLSYLVPRYLVMMGHNTTMESMYDDFKQWYSNNERPARFEDGVQYGSWKELNRDLREHPWKVELLPSQSVTTRWIANLEKMLERKFHSEFLITVYGVTLDVNTDIEDDLVGTSVKYAMLSGDNPNPPLFTADDSQQGEKGGSNTQNYFLDGLMCSDGWQNDFYYYSPPPYQNYRLWSAGPNGKTFPPWIPEEEFARDQTLQANSRMIHEWISDDIAHLGN